MLYFIILAAYSFHRSRLWLVLHAFCDGAYKFPARALYCGHLTFYRVKPILRPGHHLVQIERETSCTIDLLCHAAPPAVLGASPRLLYVIIFHVT